MATFGSACCTASASSDSAPSDTIDGASTRMRAGPQLAERRPVARVLHCRIHGAGQDDERGAAHRDDGLTPEDRALGGSAAPAVRCNETLGTARLPKVRPAHAVSDVL